jgi:hypothetical protein
MRIFILVLLLITVQVQWQPNQEVDLAGYRIYLQDVHTRWLMHATVSNMAHHSRSLTLQGLGA